MKLALGVEYNGKAYHGWQRQRGLATIQGCLERALSTIAEEIITVYCAGRTDTGVHAIEQVVHFTTRSQRSDDAWTIGVNSHLPTDIAVRWVAKVTDDFHARFSALSRHYRYIIYNHQLRSALHNCSVTHYSFELNTLTMARAAHSLLGMNNFTSFRAHDCQSKNPWRNIYYIQVIRQGRYVIIDIKANAFLHHMVRNIVGSLIEVGSGYKEENWISELLKCCDRKKAGPTASAAGLYLIGVDYPMHFSLPLSSPWSFYLLN
ncbi:pseudouridylate synthase I [secondary endosymbiont of Heteropsylla cubana]|uniref:tRNA pseudouridine synthase A n=1 Tax=secondary endosymbiont of Heteropsylla cubana TaxID=134287 RepID=J3TGT3_9ENTR|nr:tRNA pseudouridine(38-40) synthase TruA [secondary endosymbiont of Heteropsylla cubana]AFP85722.1 pseudouridylate synthase I [secondary endosymbiont of Heteropsylla cubana]